LLAPGDLGAGGYPGITLPQKLATAPPGACWGGDLCPTRGDRFLAGAGCLLLESKATPIPNSPWPVYENHYIEELLYIRIGVKG